eukprot:1192089-Amphidinium_carterae.1
MQHVPKRSDAPFVLLESIRKEWHATTMATVAQALLVSAEQQTRTHTLVVLFDLKQVFKNVPVSCLTKWQTR